MTLSKEYNGRTFYEGEYFRPSTRRIAGLSSNHVWLYTVERGSELNRKTGEFSDKVITRIANELSSSSFISISAEEYEKLYKESRNQKSEKHKLYKLIQELRSTVETERQIFRKKLSIMRSKMKELESILREYNTLISNDGTSETDIHKFIVESNAFWMFGLEYVSIESKVRFPPGKNIYEFDLMLQRYDSFWDLVELKGPNENIFNKRTQNRNKPNQKLSEAICQVFTYLYYIDQNYSEELVKPKAYIVIGNKKTDKEFDRRIFSSYMSNVDLITHAELYEWIFRCGGAAVPVGCEPRFRSCGATVPEWKPLRDIGLFFYSVDFSH
jgi:DNA-directed RNA polymerase subunit F